MDLFEKAVFLGRAAKWDVFEGEEGEERGLPRCWIYRAAAGGRRVPIFKTLLSNACRNNCLYCANRADRPVPRFSLSPEEFARAFQFLWSRGLVEGAFISSSVEGDPDLTMEKILAAAEIIRRNMGFQGYLHIKIMPGAKAEYVKRALELGSRISINLEAANEFILQKISPQKDFREILSLLEAGSRLREESSFPVALTSQIIIGLGEKDRDLLELSERLYRRFRIWRCYYSPFEPVPGTPLEKEPPAPKEREKKLYRADFLIRLYGFKASEIPFSEEGEILGSDPKLMWALLHPDFFPVDVNRAPYHKLLRVPGIGPRSARAILRVREEGGRVRTISELKALGVDVRRASPFIILEGRSPEASFTLPLELSRSEEEFLREVRRWF